MDDHTSRIDADQVKAAAISRELELLEYVAHIDREILDGKHHACPKCGGEDRFRLIDAKAGAVYCNQCFNSKNGDFLAAIQHFRGISFPQALQESAYRLGLTSSLDGGNGRPRKASQEGSPPATDPLIRMAEVKRCPVESLRTYGATSFPTQRAVGFPMFDANGAKCSQFDIWPDATDDVHRKGMNQKGKPTGVFLPIENGDPRLPAVGETWLIVEGVKDASAAHGLGLLAVGLPGKSIKREWLEMFRGVNVLICLHNDKAGREAAPKLEQDLQAVAAIVRIVTLPHPGDLRDNLAVEGGEQAVRDAIEKASQEGEPAEPPAFTRLIDCRELLALDLRPRFLVRGVLVAGQPCVIGGRSKTLKTSVATDLVVSLGSGSQFLGTFDTERVNVAFWSGESGAATIRETARRVADAKGVDLQTCSILWSFDIPKLARDDHLQALAETIKERSIDVAILDPLYLSLLDASTASQAGNLFTMGAALQPLGEIGQRTGCTMIVLHHFRKSGAPDIDEPAALEELAQSGVAEWCRQWLLLARRSPYQADGHHELWLRAGGSFGHAGLWAIDVDEGQLDPDTLDGRRWDVSVKQAGDARNEIKRDRENKKAERAGERDADHRRRVLVAMGDYPDGATKRDIKTDSGLNTDNFARAARQLVKEMRIEEITVEKNGRKYDGYRLTNRATGQPGQPGQDEVVPVVPVDK